MPEPAPPTHCSRQSRWALRVAMINLAFVIVIWTVLITSADVDVWPTLLLFGPRMVIAIPTVIVMLLAVRTRSYRVAVLGVGALAVTLGPIAGGTLSLGSAFAGETKSYRLRIVSLNCGGKLAKRELYDSFIAKTEPDIIALQEMPSGMDEWLKDWNGVRGSLSTGIFSKFPLTPVPPLGEQAMGKLGGATGAVIETPVINIPFYSLHLITPRHGFEAIISKKLNGLDDLRYTIRLRDAGSRNTRDWVGDPRSAIIVGDFNMPVESRIYDRDWGKFRNAFSDRGNGFGLTRHTRNLGVRIDHILFSTPWKAQRAWVGSEVGSDHSPLVAELTLESD